MAEHDRQKKEQKKIEEGQKYFFANIYVEDTQVICNE